MRYGLQVHNDHLISENKMIPFYMWGWVDVAKMAFHAIFQYIVLAINDTHNTWTNMIVKMIILSLLGSSDVMTKRI